MTALITGINGQDGAYLAAHLLARGRPVIGTRRPGSAPESLWRLHELRIAGHPDLRLVDADLTDIDVCRALLAATRPRELFHLAGQTRVAEAFRDPLASARANGLSAVNLLDALRIESEHTHFVLASSAEIFGDATQSPQTETTPFAPRHPYAIAKHFAHAMTVSYRDTYNLHASCAILFNHESPLRDEGFVTRKIAAAAVRLARGEGAPLLLGNLDARRDFGYAPEYAAAMAAMAAQPRGDDYVIATGAGTTIREFAELAFGAAGVPLHWRGTGLEEQACDAHGRQVIGVDPALFRRQDAAALVGDAAKARAHLGFAPRTSVAELARLMVEAEVRRLR